ncbi:DUF2306 domain-containing protein [Flavobacterium sp. RHBU_24]|uniref:DUF2306 domain-containing protein n=1 Tax=Flavobacterium sp. RHBU_24 TaxID=3391185 RepID=UPI003984FE2D
MQAKIFKTVTGRYTWMMLLPIGIFAYFYWLMLRLTLEYVPYDTAVSFLMIKQTEVTTLPEYRYIFYAHVYTSIFVLLFGFIQFFTFTGKAGKRLHRLSGYLYVVGLLAIAGPSGLYMSVYANGGLPAKVSFVLLSLLWWYTTWRAMQAIRAHNFTSHRNWMIRSYALCLSAVTLRIWKVVIAFFFDLPPMDRYVIIAWLGWVLNLIVAEVIISRKFKTIK